MPQCILIPCFKSLLVLIEELFSNESFSIQSSYKYWVKPEEQKNSNRMENLSEKALKFGEITLNATKHSFVCAQKAIAEHTESLIQIHLQVTS